mmetsp:Transcript_5335/g.12657  ORF Transcript_5335/g.12657 Transcript_5335/m.12657 type:complete len:330 (-) Transcript_5335:472-1461(-)
MGGIKGTDALCFGRIFLLFQRLGRYSHDVHNGLKQVDFLVGNGFPNVFVVCHVKVVSLVEEAVELVHDNHEFLIGLIHEAIDNHRIAHGGVLLVLLRIRDEIDKPNASIVIGLALHEFIQLFELRLLKIFLQSFSISYHVLHLFRSILGLHQLLQSFLGEVLEVKHAHAVGMCARCDEKAVLAQTISVRKVQDNASRLARRSHNRGQEGGLSNSLRAVDVHLGAGIFRQEASDVLGGLPKHYALGGRMCRELPFLDHSPWSTMSVRAQRGENLWNHWSSSALVGFRWIVAIHKDRGVFLEGDCGLFGFLTNFFGFLIHRSLQCFCLGSS